MKLERIPCRLSICKLDNMPAALPDAEFCFFARTDREISLVCPEELVPGEVFVRDDDWRAFRVGGTLDFSLVGILSRISGVLADAGIGIFAVSTYDTDYILVKEENFERALEALEDAGCEIG